MAGFGHIDTHDLPYLFTYEEAVKREAETKPIRGDANATKPLGKRSRKHINIRRCVEDIIIRLHNTDVIRYKPNGDVIINNGGWPSPSTHDVWGGVLNLSAFRFDAGSWIHATYIDEDGGRASGKFHVPNNTDVTLTRDMFHPKTGLTPWEIKATPKMCVHRVKRKVANQVRAKYKTFTTYLMGMAKLRTEYQEVKEWTNDGYQPVQRAFIRVVKEELEAAGVNLKYRIHLNKAHAQQAEDLRDLMMSENMDDQYKAALIFMICAYGSNWMRDGGIMFYPSALTDFYRDFTLFLHRDEVLEYVAVTDGSMKKDPYRDWMS